jgi:branched-chain amino acid transport system permease protein
MIEFLQVFIYGLAVGSIYGLVALGFVLVFKTSGTFNLAQGELLMILAFVCWAFIGWVKLPFYVAVFLTMVIAVMMGYIFERILLRPMIGESIMSVLMMTLGLAITIKALAMFVFSHHVHRYPQWLPSGDIHIGGLALSWEYSGALITAMVILAFFALFFKKSRFALAMRAVGANQVVAQAAGVKISSVYGLSWAFALVVAAVGGIILGTLTSVNNTLAAIGLYIFPALIIGGMESIPGTIVGGLIVGVCEKMAAMYLGNTMHGFPAVSPYVLAIIFLYIKPAGLWGEKEIERI